MFELFGLLSNVSSLPKYRTKTRYAQHGAMEKIKKGRPVS